MSISRQFAAPAILTVFSAVSVLGTGLHLLPGCGHFHGLVPHLHGHRCATHDLSAPCLVKTAAFTTEPEIGHSHDDCAICRFLALPRALTASPRIVERGTPFEFVLDATTPQPPLRIERPYAARGPPAFSTNA